MDTHLVSNACRATCWTFTCSLKPLMTLPSSWITVVDDEAGRDRRTGGAGARGLSRARGLGRASEGERRPSSEIEET